MRSKRAGVALIAAIAINVLIYSNIGLYFVIAAVVTAVLFFIFKDYTYGLILMIFLIPLDSITVIIPGFTMTKMLGIITFAAFLLSKKNEKIKLPDSFLIIFFTYMSLSTIWSIDKMVAIERVFNLANYLIFLTLMLNVEINEISIKKYLNPYILGCLILSCLGIYNFLESGGSQRVAAFSGENMNFYGLTLGAGILACLYLCKLFKHLRKVYLLICITFVLGQIVSFSRTAWVATFISVFIYFIGSRFSIKRILSALAAFASILILPFLLLKEIVPGAVSLILQRVSTIFTLSDKAAGRLDIWKVAVDIFKDNAILGVGINNFPTAFTYGYLINSSASMNTGMNADPHNLYICILVELGIVGMLVFLVFFANLFKNVLAVKRPLDKDFCIALLFYIGTAGLSSTILYKKYFWYILSLIMMWGHSSK